MSNEAKKCAHVPCRCMLKSGDKYCSPACKEAGSEEVEISCPCGHAGCEATA